MRISAKSDYACRALLELALRWPDKTPLRIQEIADKQRIPLRYLVHILIQMKQRGLVASVRGNQGGYYLTQAPRRIRLGDVLADLQGPLLSFPQGGSSKKGAEIFPRVWHDVEKTLSESLNRITFEELRDKIKGMTQNVSYQI